MTMPVSPLVFESIEPVEVPVTLGGKRYVLREAPGSVAADWRNAQYRAAQAVRGPDGEYRGPGEIGGTDAILVGGCLFPEADTHGIPTRLLPPVGTEFALALPARILRPLFETAKEISHLGERVWTVEELRREISFLQDKLADLERHEANGYSSELAERRTLKNLPAPSGDGSS